MTAENSFIECPLKPERLCQIRNCIQNPNAPECVQFERGREGKEIITTPQLIGKRRGALNEVINSVYRATGRFN